METLIVHTETKEELKTVKSIMKALKVKFEESPYNAEFAAKIKQGKKDIKAGRTTKITKRLFGTMAGTIHLSPDFNAPLEDLKEYM